MSRRTRVWLVAGLLIAPITAGVTVRLMAQAQATLTDMQLLNAARAEAAADRTIRDSGQDPATWPASKQPDGSVTIHSPNRLIAVKASPDGTVAVFENRGGEVHRRQLLAGVRVDLQEGRTREDTPVIPFGAPLDMTATGVAANAPTTPVTTADPAPPPVTIRLVPVNGAPDSVTLGQNFRIEVEVPSGQAQSRDFTVTLATADGVDEQDVIVTLDDASNGIATFRSAPISIGGTRDDWRPTVLPFGWGQVSIGGATTPGTIMGLDLGNGDSITATITLPTGVAGTSIQVFDTPTDQALARSYLAMFNWQESLRVEAQLLGQALASNQFSADQRQVMNGLLVTNGFLRSWLNIANERAAKESTKYAQLAILTGYLTKVNQAYEVGVSDPVEELRVLDMGIARNIADWAGGVTDAFLTGTALAFYNGVTSIPFTNAGYTLSTSLYTSFETGTFNTGQTVWGTEATFGRWVWAWVEVAGQASLMRMYSNPYLGMNPFRDSRATITPLAPSALKLVNPIELALWNQAARVAQRVADNAARAGRTVDIIAEHQRAYQQLGALAGEMGLPSATRFLNALQDAAGLRLRVNEALLRAQSAVPRRLPPINLPGTRTPAATPRTAPPPAAPPAAPVSSVATPVARGWPAAPAPPAPAVGPVVPGGVIIVDSMLVGQNRIVNPGGLSGVPPSMLYGSLAEQAHMAQAVLNPSLVRISEWNVNFGGFVLRRLNPSEWALFCSNAARRTGPGTTQAGAALPLLGGAMNRCFGSLNNSPSTATSGVPMKPVAGARTEKNPIDYDLGADLEAAADRIEWLGCDYAPRANRVKGTTLWMDGIGQECRSYSAPPRDAPPQWTSFGYDPGSDTVLFGAPPPIGYVGIDWNAVPGVEERAFNEFLDSFNVDAFRNGVMLDSGQLLAARWRRERPVNQTSTLPVVPRPPDHHAARPALPFFQRWLLRLSSLAHASRLAGLVTPSGSGNGAPPPNGERDGVGSGARGQRVPSTLSPAGDVKVFFTSLGRSSGEALRMTIVNGRGVPLKIRGHALSLKPIARLTERDVERELQKLSHLPKVTVALDAYCQNFDKAPPTAGMVFGLADAKAQAAMGPVHRVFDAVDRLVGRSALRPDSDPAEYEDALIQWSIWTLEKKFDERSYTSAFINHARKNVTSGGRRWTSEIERAIGALAPARWQAIQQVLREAGVAAR